MKNPRITKKEQGLIKGALRRVFSRSDLRKEALQRVIVAHTDPTRSRVKKWGKCPLCTQLHPLYTFMVDHIDPVIPINSSMGEISADELIDRIWCLPDNLQAICEICHNEKTALERKQRKEAKNGKNLPVKKVQKEQKIKRSKKSKKSL